MYSTAEAARIAARLQWIVSRATRLTATDTGNQNDDGQHNVPVIRAFTTTWQHWNNMLTTYDSNNIFAKILRGEIPCDTVYEDEYALAFHDITPQAPVHVLVIPKGEYVSFDDFSSGATPETVAGFYRAVQSSARLLGLGDNGYRVISNIGKDARQEVKHYHLHILGGCDLGSMMKRGLV